LYSSGVGYCWLMVALPVSGALITSRALQASNTTVRNLASAAYTHCHDAKKAHKFSPYTRTE
jgi:hypothetical protein